MADPALTNNGTQILWIQGEELLQLTPNVTVPVLPEYIKPAQDALLGPFKPFVDDGSITVWIPDGWVPPVGASAEFPEPPDPLPRKVQPYTRDVEAVEAPPAEPPLTEPPAEPTA